MFPSGAEAPCQPVSLPRRQEGARYEAYLLLPFVAWLVKAQRRLRFSIYDAKEQTTLMLQPAGTAKNDGLPVLLRRWFSSKNAEPMTFLSACDHEAIPFPPSGCLITIGFNIDPDFVVF